jgi:hypothetical protein
MSTETLTRRDAILQAIDSMLAEYENWLDDPAEKYIAEGGALDDAIFLAGTICDAGEIPSRCRQLIDAIGRVQVEYEMYQGGDFDPQTTAPLPKFHAAMKAVLNARQGAEAPQRRVMETIAAYDKQDLKDHQIARLFGHRVPGGALVGPFYGPGDRVLSDKIQAERDKPGTIITANWAHPSDEAEERLASLESSRRLERVAKRGEAASDMKWDDADVAKYLREGAFPQQAVKRYGISLQRVLAIAKEHEIAVDMPLTPSQIQAADKTHKPGNKINQDIDSRVLDLSAAGKLPGEIAGILSAETRTKITVQKVTGIITRATPDTDDDEDGDDVNDLELVGAGAGKAE